MQSGVAPSNTTFREHGLKLGRSSNVARRNRRFLMAKAWEGASEKEKLVMR